MINLIPLQYKLGAVALLLLAVAGFGYYKGAESVHEDWEAQKAADAVAFATLKAKQESVSAAVDKRHVREAAKIRTVYETIIKEVKTYVKADPAYSCVIPDSLVRFHNDAALGVISPSPGGVDAESGRADITAP